MTFDKLRVSIFEAYQNDEISRDTCESMLESVLDMEGNHIVAEAENARTEFMGVAMEAAQGSVEFAAFEKKAESCGDKIKNAWKKFVAWVKKIIDAVKSKLGFKKKWYVQVSDEFDKLIDKVINLANGVTANMSPIQLAGAITGIIGAVGAAGFGIFKGVKKHRSEAGEQVKKLNKGLNAVHKISSAVSDWYNKDGNIVKKVVNPDIEYKDDPKKKDNANKDGDAKGSSNILMAGLRKLAGAFNAAITALHKRFGRSDAADNSPETVPDGHVSPKYDDNGTMADGQWMVDQGSATSDFASGNIMAESSDNLDDDNFDFESMLADLDI